MFDYIQGKVVSRHPTHIVLETGGIGYHLHITLHSYDQIEEGKERKVFTWLQVREDVQQLWGFLDTLEREVFFAPHQYIRYWTKYSETHSFRDDRR